MVQASIGVERGTAPSSADPKLVHLVKKLQLAATSATQPERGGLHHDDGRGVASSSSNSTAHARDIVERLRNQHREYQRKDLDRLTAQVETILQHLCSTTAAASPPLRPPAAGAASAGRKRKVPDPKGGRRSRGNDGDDPSGRIGDEDEREDEAEDSNKNVFDHDEDDLLYERAARAHDAMQSHLSSTTDGGGGLNAALRNRYLANAQQQEQRKGALAASVSEENPSEPQMDNVPERRDTEAATPNRRDDAVKSPKVIKRKGSKLLKRSSSGVGGGGMASDPSSSASCSFLVPVERPHERYHDLGGMDAAVQELRQLVEYPLMRPELYRHLGIDPPRGVLLRGPPGCGKTHVANAVAGELGLPYYRVSAPELVSGMSGESEGRIRDLFAAASDTAPALVFLDEIDAIAPKRGDGGGGSGGGRGMEKRMVAQLLTCLDMLAPQNNRNQSPVLVLAATNRPDALDPALRRAGRFDKEILLGVPDEEARERILRSATRSMRLSGGFDYKLLARKTPGYVGADVQSLAKEAAIIAIHRICQEVLHESVDASGDTSIQHEPVASRIGSLAPLSVEQMKDLYVTMDDFLEAVPLVQPSSKREGFATVPDVSWNDIGALHSIRDELTLSVLEPIRSPEKFKALGLTLPAGVLLYGPPGCGKTLLAKAIANESGANFISVKGPELLDKYVGESERAVRLVFERARSSSPCIVFFDELDSLVPKRGSDSSGSGVSERVVNQILTELDGLDSRRSVFVIAATNRPELIDPAMLRPGRLDKLLYVPLPSPDDRVSILQALAVNVALDTDVDFGVIGRSARANGYSGADCSALLREAGLAVIKEDADAGDRATLSDSLSLRISARHFDAAFSSVMPSVSIKDQARYDRIRDRIARVRCRIEPEADCGEGDDGEFSLKRNALSHAHDEPPAAA